MTIPDTKTIATLTDSEVESLHRELSDYKLLYERFRGRLRDVRESCAYVRRVADDYDRKGFRSVAEGLWRAERIIRGAADGHAVPALPEGLGADETRRERIGLTEVA